MKQAIFFVTIFILLAGFHAFGQPDILINAGPDTTLPCGASCFNYSIKVPVLKSTDDYRVDAIPYNPYPFVTAVPGLTMSCTDQDDKYYNISSFGFKFCFYGNTYESMVIGTNGVATFDLSNALDCNQWQMIDAAGPLPFIGNGLQCKVECSFPADVLYPRACIMGVYNDMAIDKISPDKKVEFRVEGTAPFRRAIVSFYKIPVYECTTTFTTSQFVIYETTGIIEVYVKDKAPCTKWNDGNAILGIQNWERDKGIAPPGRNIGVWGANNMNEAWRFTPDGNTSLLDHVDLLLNNAVVATGVPGSIANGFTNIDFSNICLPAESNNYTVKAYYKNCENGGGLFSAEDNFNAFKTAAASLTADVVDAACAAGSHGIIDVTAPLGSRYKYSADGIAFQYSTLFNLNPGAYTITAKDTVTGCSASATFTINSLSTLTAQAQVTDALCSNSATGGITISASGGQSPYQYSIDGSSLQASNVFSNIIPGTYALKVTDNAGCVFNFSEEVGNKPGVTATATVTDAACNGSATGSIAVNAIGGLTPYSYSINNGAQVPSSLFSALTPGNYLLQVEDKSGCTFSFSKDVAARPGVTATAAVTRPSCNTVNDGKIIITPSGGRAPYQYSNNAGLSYQALNTFSNINANVYSLAVKDADNCIYNFTVNVLNDPGVTVDTIIDKASCSAIPNGKITINPVTGKAPFVYSFNGAAFQNTNQFANLFAGNYTIGVKDNAGCTATIAAVVESEPQLVLDSVITKNVSCNGLNDGVIKIYPRLGVQPYNFQINNGTYQSSNSFSNIAAAQNINIHIKDNSGCIKDTVITITQPAKLSINTTAENATCNGNDGKINTIAAGGIIPYQYTIDPLLLTGFQANPQFLVQEGTYTVSVKDANGCTASTNETVLMVDTMRLELGNDTTVCSGSPVAFQPNTNPQTNVFAWQPSTGLNNAAIKNPVATATDTTKYYLTAIWGVCQRTDSITINVLLKPTPNAGADTAVCLNTKAFLHGNSGKVSGPVNYLWEPAAFLDNTAAANTFVSPVNAGTYLYTLTVSDNYGCNFSVKDQITVTMQPPVPAFAGNDTAAVLGQPIRLHATGGVNYSWQPADLFDDPFVANPLATMEQDSVRFTVTVKDIAGCVGSDEILVIAYTAQTYFMPNAFSPNGDGHNDIFKPIAIGIQSTDYFRIFNRYGSIVFETGKDLQGWDGMYKGKKQSPGVYVWNVRGKTISGRVVEMKGTVMLVQ